MASDDNRLTRRDFVTATTALTLASTVGCGAESGAAEPDPTAAPAAVTGEASKPNRRVVILGFDGVEPSIVDAMLDAGELPNLARLRDSGGAYSRLRSTTPPQSPTAWTSFATSKNPGGHGIFDFIRRDPKTYFPMVGTSKTDSAVLNADGSLKQAARSEGFRVGEPFWSLADRQGLRCKVLNVPFAYPPDKLEHGLMICGLDVPDLRGTTSTCFSFSEGYAAEEMGAGVVKMPLRFADNRTQVELEAIRVGEVKGGKQERVARKVPLAFVADRTGRSVTIETGNATLTLPEGQWSEWVEWDIALSDKVSVRSISRFFVLEAGEQVRVYMTCLQFHPSSPYIPFTEPKQFSSDLSDRYGLYKTIGWAFDTHALRQDALTEDAFLEDTRQTMAWREQLTLDEIDRGDFDLLISAWTATDRIGHMFWRFRDPQHPLYTEEGAKKYGRALEESYVRMDEIVGKVASRLQPDDVLMVLSDHGFCTFRTGFNINTWLVRNGYAAIKGQSDAETAWADGWPPQIYDWARTRAYAIGLSSVYLNLKGREAQGIVDPAEADALISEIAEKMLQVEYPETGEKVFSAIRTRKDFSGVSMAHAPDIAPGYAVAYQSTKDTAKGSCPKDLFEPVTDKWSGEHAATDLDAVPGMLFTNRPLSNDAPDIRDLGVTALACLGVTAPADCEGAPVIEG